MSAIIALSGFACAVVVLIVERTARNEEIRQARNEGYLIGYREASVFQDSHEARFFRGLENHNETQKGPK